MQGTASLLLVVVVVVVVVGTSGLAHDEQR
jgi:Sec-independent protein translocase protein TatA